MDNFNSIVLKALKELRTDVVEYRKSGKINLDTSTGICSNVCDRVDWWVQTGVYKWVENSSKNWLEFSGIKDYPVEHPAFVRPADGYTETPDKWIGGYGNNRMKLLDYLIECLEKEMNK